MTLQLSRILNRLLATGLLVIVAAAIYAATVSPVLERIHAAKDSIAEHRSMLGRLDAENAASSSVNSTIGASGSLTREAIFLTGSSNAGRVANLQARLATLAGSADVSIRSAREIAIEERDKLPLLGVEILFRATSAQLQALLTDIERDRPHLFIDGLLLAPAPLEAAARLDAIDNLDVTLRIVGVVERAKG